MKADTDDYQNMSIGKVLEINCEEPSGEPAEPSVPNFVDLAPYLSGDYIPECPSVAEALPGNSLFYAGRLNEIHGEPGEGKTNVAISAMNLVLAAGGSVIYLDPEDNPRGFSNRALGLGGDAAAIIERVKYLHNPTQEELAQAQRWAKTNPPTLVILDGVAESLVAAGLNEDSNSDVLLFLRESVRPFADVGAAVLLLDHVTKSQESRGRFARGAGSKLGRYDGAVYLIELGKAYTPEEAGFVRLRVAKDRNGGIGVPRGQVAFELHFHPMGHGTQIEFVRPKQSKGDFLPTCLMEKVSRFVELHPAGVSGNQIEKGVPGNNEHKRKAIFHLLDKGFLRVEAKGKTNLHFHTKPFRESEWNKTP